MVECVFRSLALSKPLTLPDLSGSSSVFPTATAAAAGAEDPEQQCDTADWGPIPAVCSLII